MAAEIPASVNYGKVVGRFIKAVDDSADVDHYPDGAPVVGTVTFTPSVPLVVVPGATPPTTVFLKARTCTLDADGFIVDEQSANGIYLVATDDADTSPNDWVWAVTFDFTGLTLAGFAIEVPADGEVDLSQVMPVPAVTGAAAVPTPVPPTFPWWYGTQSEYDAIVSPDPDTLYVIHG